MARPRLLITRRLPAAVQDRLGHGFEITVNSEDAPLDKAALRQAVKSFDAICPTITDRFDADILAAPGLTTKILANFGAGIEHIDLGAAQRAGIVVTNTPDALTDATAELAITLMLMASRRASEGERILRAGRWAGWAPTHMLGQSLAGKTLGLVGFGRIAKETARRAQAALKMNIAYFSRRRAPEDEAAFGADHFSSLEDLAAVADVLSLHCPGGEATRHIINAPILSRMRPHAILINTSRGSVVDEAALASVLAERRIAAAGLDVYENEPRVHEALTHLENVVLLPHLGSATIETRTAMGMQAATNLERFFAGEPPLNRVA